MKVIIVAALVAVAVAAPADPYRPAAAYSPAPTYRQPAYKQPEHSYTPYQFDYAVNDHYSGAVFAQNENSDAKNVNGYYSVNLPDGRVQTVKYVADHDGYGGFNAEVSYSGEAQYDEHKPSYHPAPAPAYKPRY